LPIGIWVPSALGPRWRRQTSRGWVVMMRRLMRLPGECTIVQSSMTLPSAGRFKNCVTPAPTMKNSGGWDRGRDGGPISGSVESSEGGAQHQHWVTRGPRPWPRTQGPGPEAPGRTPPTRSPPRPSCSRLNLPPLPRASVVPLSNSFTTFHIYDNACSDACEDHEHPIRPEGGCNGTAPQG
jgi:hypothetical protein